MRTQLARWILALGILAMLVGCDGGGDDNMDPLTMANLQGAYDLARIIHKSCAKGLESPF